MSETYPRVRIRSESGSLLLREGLSLTFCMRHPHEVIAPQVKRSLEAYLRAVGPQALGWYADLEGEFHKLDDAGWQWVHRELLTEDCAVIRLYDADLKEFRYQFEYHGGPLVDLAGRSDPDEICWVRCWLPSEFLEVHGPERLRELALELAAPLPFASGYAGLSFNGDLDLIGVTEEVVKRCFRYPGLDISTPPRKLGPRIRGVQWLTLLGQPVLGALGGTAGLAARLHEPGSTLQEMQGERVLITLGSRPEAGDTEQGHLLPAYRELARVLEPWLHREERVVDPSFPPEARRRWERRFLD